MVEAIAGLVKLEEVTARHSKVCGACLKPPQVKRLVVIHPNCEFKGPDPQVFCLDCGSKLVKMFAKELKKMLRKMG